MANPISLKLTIDKEKNRVLFAECDNDFIDILFSILTLPMGTIVRLLDKKSGVGFFDKLYESVENLNTEYFETAACKNMLLQPRSAAERECEDLKINIDDLQPRKLYRCKWDCVTTHCLFSYVPGVHCRCGHLIDAGLQWRKGEVDTLDGVFVKRSERFIVTDNLHVRPLSIEATVSLLQSFGIKDIGALESLTVDVGKPEILSLLKAMLQCKTPMTNVFLKGAVLVNGDSNIEDLQDASSIIVEGDSAEGSKTVDLRIPESKSLNKLVCFESGGDMVDYLLSLLTFPLGAIVKFLNKNSSIFCVDNLYRSVEALSDHHLKSEERKEMLLSPMLAAHFGCSNRLVFINEKQNTKTCSIRGCHRCFIESKENCCHGVKDINLTMINPKLPVHGMENGGGFAKKSMKFMVTSDMHVSPLSLSIFVNTMKEFNVPISGLFEREVSCGEAQVLALMKACLTSQTVSSSVFSLKKRTRTSFLA